MVQEGWTGIVAGELMVPPERVQSLAAVLREVGVRLTPADLIGAGAGASQTPAVLAARPATSGPPAFSRPSHKPRGDRLRSWR